MGTTLEFKGHKIHLVAGGISLTLLESLISERSNLACQINNTHMKDTYSRLAVKRWKAKGLVTEDNGKQVLTKDGKKYLLTLNGKKYGVEPIIEEAGDRDTTYEETN